MKKFLIHLFLWIIAIVITLFSAAYQRRTGPTYPLQGTEIIDGSAVDYILTRSHGGAGDQIIQLTTTDTMIVATLVYRRFKTNDSWTRIPMQRIADKRVAALPHQPPAGKLEYHVELEKRDTIVSIPREENAVTRFKGEVPTWALIPHVLFMFFAMLLSTRTGLQALIKDAPLKAYVAVTLLLLLLGGFVFGPIVQKFAFDAYWTGLPFGTDLTDNKTLIALVAWLVALFAHHRNPKNRWIFVAAALVMLIIFLIPHSLHGSELDYSTLDS